MAKFNRGTVRPAGRGPVDAEAVPSGRTYEGGPGHARELRGDLFLLAVANFVSEKTFYEDAGERDARYRSLLHRAAVEDPAWTAGLLGWLRGEGNMRTAAVVGAAEYVRARLAAAREGAADAGADTSAPTNRQVVDSVLQRADEPGELLAYWMGRYGRALPKPLKRGVGDAVGRLYTERALLKYDAEGRAFRFGDVLDLVHAAPAADRPWQGDLFAHALDRRHGRDKPIPESLHLLRARARLMALPVPERRPLLDHLDAAQLLRRAGMTWEALAGWLQGPMDAAAWEAVLPSMGYMARLRNLRNFDQAGVSDELAERVAAGLADPAEVARSRQLPMRFLSAYRTAPSLRWGHALERAVQASLENVPRLDGRTLVLVDRSGSMWSPLSARSDLNRADAAAVFGSALAMRARAADLVEFGTSSRPVAFGPGDSLLRAAERFGSLGGTNTAAAVREHYRGHDRVVIVTDEQAAADPRGGPTEQVPATVPVYTWNLAGYRYGHGPSGEGRRHTFGGLSDAAFRMIPLIEAGARAAWPWQD
ncbi:TROVE domain-containing protein [Allonocardiopsis opalescens]|uniref:TROVE domain-containing protein n=1 Tax=Allonocardiopsis opalescens TaxID=1144618 RepID=A0A2T0Q6Y6_9ACTN|nr:TROVE domain-containing protein [Allonocardiopsis opalescens]PRX99587.1 TROVE domain-containing protein [Allonocardiopsis opalescens]